MQKVPGSPHFSVRLLSNGTLELVTCTGPATRVTVPDAISGVPVTAISSKCFWRTTLVETIHIPRSVTHICLQVPGDFPSNPFARCLNLTAITVDEANPAFTAVDGVLYTRDMRTLIAYPGMKAGDSFRVPDGVQTIAYQAFAAPRLHTVAFPDSVTVIDHMNFNRNTFLTGVRLSSSLMAMAGTSFRHCPLLSEVSMANGNGAFTLVDGVLYSRDMTILVLYPAARQDASFTIPPSVRHISSRAFARARNLTSLVIPGTGTRLTQEALSGFSAGGVTFTVVPGSEAEAFCRQHGYTTVTSAGK